MRGGQVDMGSLSMEDARWTRVPDLRMGSRLEVEVTESKNTHTVFHGDAEQTWPINPTMK